MFCAGAGAQPGTWIEDLRNSGLPWDGLQDFADDRSS
jgi:hypothetical protein